jgi:hypothetical protein
MKIRILLLISLTVFAFPQVRAASLEQGWQDPPTEARLRAYWWWLNGHVTKEAITRDLEQMKAKGFGGAIITDADGSSQDGNDRAPHGPTFFSSAWRELFKHTLREANRLGLEMSLNIQSGWNLGGPMVTPDDAPKKLVWTEARVNGNTNLVVKIEQPRVRESYYRDLFVLAFPVHALPRSRKLLQNLEQKALLRALEPFSAPDSRPLFQELPATPNEQDANASEVIDLTKNFSTNGVLTWEAPPGEWQVIRIGCTLNDHCRVSTCSEGWDGYAIDPFDAGAFTRYWDAVVEPLISDAEAVGRASSRAGSSGASPHPLKYLHADSWEVEVANWTPTLREEFRKRRGYDLLRWLPVITGKIINSREESDRFLNDFRRTMGDLAIDNHYKLFKENAHKHSLLIHPESGGPHAVPIDAQQCLGFDDAPMSEFWAWSWRHRIGDENRFFVKQPASAAHTYGRKLVLAEGFTTIGPHWQETLWDNLKPSFDHACTEGLNLLVWHAFVCSPASEGIPGQQYFAGTHLNPNVTWWEKSKPFFDYINRCQWMLQQGLPVADVTYYYGDHVPNFAQLRKSDPAKIGAGYDYDVITAEALLTRAKAQDGKIVLPDGVSYRVLALPERDSISLPVLRKIKELVTGGATIIGPRPMREQTLKNFPECDNEVTKLATEIWDNKTNNGRVISNRTAREFLLSDGVNPDFYSTAALDYIHRRDGESEIYFVSSRSNVSVTATCAFRVSGKAPELWNAVTDEHKFASAYEEKNGGVTLTLEFSPCGSWFIIFREPASKHPANAASNERTFTLVQDISGEWRVHFDPKWRGPESVQFDQLTSWPTHSDPGIKFYSGTATYVKTFELPDPKFKTHSKLFLDLGNVHELAEVRLNGKSCGISWSPPFRVNVTDAIKSGENKLEIEVVNFWPNRIIGDASLPQAERLTRTNVRKLTAGTKLMDSGLLGPVRLLRIE